MKAGFILLDPDEKSCETSGNMKEAEGSGKSQDINRQEILKILGLTFAGSLLGGIVYKKEDNYEVVEEKNPALYSVSLALETVPAKIVSEITANDDGVAAGERDKQIESFLMGATVISKYLIDRYIDGSLTEEQINAVTRAVMLLKKPSKSLEKNELLG